MAETNQGDSNLAQPISLDDWQNALSEEAQVAPAKQSGQDSPSDMPSSGGATIVEPLASVFSELGSVAHVGEGGGIDLVLDIPISVSVELGVAKVPVKGMMQLGQGAVIELDGRPGDPLSIYANGQLIAKGEVVSVNDHLGIRVTQLVGRPKPVV